MALCSANNPFVTSFGRPRETLIAFGLCLAFACPAPAAISTSGNVTPNPQTTTSSTDLFVGDTSNGSMLIEAGSTVSAKNGYLGEHSPATGSATVTGAGSKWINSQDLVVGHYGHGNLSIAAGGYVTNDNGFIGHGSTFLGPSSGGVTIDGIGSVWDNSNDLTIGGAGPGTLDISNGGKVINDTARVGDAGQGTVTVSGPGSTWDSDSTLYVANSSVLATVNVTNGGYVENQNGAIGSSSGGVGVVTVDGVGSIWKSISTLTVGDFGDGTLNITNGGVVHSPTGHIGNIFDGTVGHVYVNGAGSTWNASVRVGDSALGFMEVTNGGKVAGITGYIGYLLGAGTATIDGVGSSWTNSSTLYVGRKNTATLNVTGGAIVNNASIGYIGSDTGGNGTANIDGAGSKWSNGSDLFVGDIGNGTLNIKNGGLVEVAGTTYVGRSTGVGAVSFTGGGTLTTNTLLAPAAKLGGTGVVNTHGLVTDVDLLFDQTHDAQQQITLSALPAQNVTINLDLNSTVPIGAGYAALGTLTVSDGKTLSSGVGYLGYKAGSNGAGTVTGAGSVWSSNGTMYVGYGGHGSLEIEQGGRTNAQFVEIGSLAGSSGAATVDGASSLWAVSASLVVGNAGTGALAITNGGRVTNVGSFIADEAGTTGEVTVSGPTSTWEGVDMTVGTRGNGKVTVTGGADVTSRDAKIGELTGSTGEVSVSGAGSTWTARDVSIGRFGTGTLKILSGGSVDAESVLVAPSTGAGSVVFDSGTLAADSLLTAPASLQGTGNISAHGIVSDIDLVFDSTHTSQQQIVFNALPGQNVTIDLDANALGDLGAGFAAAGSITISEGRIVNSGGGMLAYKTGSTGLATVDGAGSTWNAGLVMYVGAGGSGTLTVSSGGVVNVGTSSVTSALYLGSALGPGAGTGIVNVNSGGTVEVYGDVVLGNSSGSSGTFNLTSGKLRMHGLTLRKGPGSAAFNFTGGLLEGPTAINLGTTFVQSGGTFAPGNGVGTTTITGGYTLDFGTLNIQLNSTGTAGTAWDLVKVTGAVNLLGANGIANGVLNIALNFAPAANSSFLIIDNDGTDAVVNRFANGTSIRSLYNNKLYQFTINYASGTSNNDISLTNTTISAQGDYNGNGIVDAADYVVWRKSRNSTVANYFAADGDGSGTIDDADFAVWRSHFGQTTGSGSGASANATVPEPSALMLLMFGVAGWCLRRCRAAESVSIWTRDISQQATV